MPPSPPTGLRVVVITSDWTFLREVLRTNIPLAGVVHVHWRAAESRRLDSLKAFAGRGPLAVQQALLWRGVPYRRVSSKRKGQIATALRDWGTDVAVSYKNPMFPREVFEVPRLGVVNLHPSLLPAYRGALPLLYAARDFCLEGGVTAHVMTKRADRGDVLGRVAYSIPLGASGDEVEQALIHERGVPLVLDCLSRFERGETQGEPQPAASPTDTAKFTDDAGKWAMIDWEWPLQRLWHYLRFSPFWEHRLPARRGWRKRVGWRIGPPVSGRVPGVPGTLQRSRRGYRVVHKDGYVEIRPTLNLRNRGKRFVSTLRGVPSRSA